MWDIFLAVLLRSFFGASALEELRKAKGFPPDADFDPFLSFGRSGKMAGKSNENEENQNPIQKEVPSFGLVSLDDRFVASSEMNPHGWTRPQNDQPLLQLPATSVHQRGQRPASDSTARRRTKTRPSDGMPFYLGERTAEVVGWVSRVGFSRPLRNDSEKTTQIRFLLEQMSPENGWNGRWRQSAKVEQQSTAED
eukprot:scaffold53_cov193-Pinguiococcus_pyrenoidosus.AAC.18